MNRKYVWALGVVVLVVVVLFATCPGDETDERSAEVRQAADATASSKSANWSLDEDGEASASGSIVLYREDAGLSSVHLINDDAVNVRILYPAATGVGEAEASEIFVFEGMERTCGPAPTPPTPPRVTITRAEGALSGTFSARLECDDDTHDFEGRFEAER